MLTEKQIEDNKARFLELIKSINIEGADIEGLANWLENRSDFFVAPASTRYHCSYKGGLCEHSLNVYDSLVSLVSIWGVEHAEDGDKPLYSEDSLKVVALLHDLSKANFYESYFRNVKNEVTGQWEKKPEYRVRDETSRFIYGSHELTAEYMVRTFIPLSVAESVAITHHHAGMSFDSTKEDVAQVYNRYPLAVLLHMADLGSTFLVETTKHE